MVNTLQPVCVFCNNSQLQLKFSKHYHPVKKHYGPFDIYRCNRCHSCVTFPLPAEKELAALYNSFADGLMPALRQIRNENALTVWYGQCIQRATTAWTNRGQTNFTWIDIGAGGGELALQMANQFPHSKGWAIDFHPRPALLNGAGNVDWVQADLNNGSFAPQLNITADIVFSITVLEHVLQPHEFIKNGIQLVKHNGVFYITAPCTNTIASKLLGRFWPYFIPGEHLNIPSVQGLKFLLQRLQEQERQQMTFEVRETILPYTLGYYLSFLKLKFFTKLLPQNLPTKLPTGILEATIKF